MVKKYEKDGKTYLRGAYVEYKDNSYIRARGKNAPDILTIELEDGTDVDISVWGKKKGEKPAKPAELEGLEEGVLISVPIFSAEYKGETKHNLDLFNAIEVSKNAPIKTKPMQTQEKRSEAETYIARQCAAKLGVQMAVVNASVTNSCVTQEQFEEMAEIAFNWINKKMRPNGN